MTLPFSVWSPTWRTLKMPYPSITFVPLITWFVGKVASFWKSCSTTLLKQIGSPVREDSSTCNDMHSSNSPSAGISFPVSILTISPTTTSRFGTTVRNPFLMTWTNSSSFILLSNVNSLSALISKIKASPVAKSIAIKIPIGSKKIEKPLSNMKYS